MNSSWVKFLILAACGLAGSDIIESDLNSHYMSGMGFVWGFLGVGATSNLTKANESYFRDNSSHRHNNAFEPNSSTADRMPGVGLCTLPCSVLGVDLSTANIVMPFALALVSWLPAALPTVLMQTRNRIQGLRCALWPLIMLWLHLIISYTIFTQSRVLGYAWALHSSAEIMAMWVPGKRVLSFQCLHWIFTSLAIFLICLYAWQTGSPAGLIRWKTGAYSECGFMVHLIAIVGVDIVMWVFEPLHLLSNKTQIFLDTELHSE